MAETIDSNVCAEATQAFRYAEWQEEYPGRLQIEVNPDSTQQWSVKFDVLLGQWISGSDEGVLWFDDQYLYVVGKKTSFAVPGHRIPVKWERRMSPIRPFQRQIYIPIGEDAKWPMAIQLDIVVTPPFVPETIALLDGLSSCRNHSNLEKEGQFPPAKRGPNAQTMVEILRHQTRFLVVAGLFTLLIWLAILFFSLEFDLGFWVTGFLLICGAAQGYRWGSPKLHASANALKSYRAYADSAVN